MVSSDVREFRVKAKISELDQRALRVKEAVRLAGGNAAVLAKSSIPKATLGNLIAGQEMKTGQLVALARATGVRLEWLATGEGPMRDGDQMPPRTQEPVQPTAAPSPVKLFRDIHMDTLADAFAMALQAWSKRGHTTLDHRRIMQITAIFYDQLMAGVAPEE